MKNGKFSKLIWVPRIIVMIFGIFLLLFSLDVFSMDGTIWEKIGGFIIHSVPSIIIFIALIMTWKRPLWGGIASIVFSVILALNTYRNWQSLLILSTPLLIAGILFLTVYVKQKKI